MALKYIVDADMLRDRMSLPDEESVNTAIESALSSAHLHIQAILKTTFEPVTKAELFWLETGKWPVIPAGRLRLRLSCGFVKQVTAVMAQLDRGYTPVALEADEYAVDAQKGIVHVNDDYEGYFIAVQYTAGFDAENKAPDWLKEAVLSYLPYVLNVQPITNRNEEAKGVAEDGRGIVARILEPYVRDVPFTFKPVL